MDRPILEREALEQTLVLQYGPVRRSVDDAIYDSGNLIVSREAFVMTPRDGLAIRYDRGSGLTCERDGAVAKVDAELWAHGFARGLVAWLNGYAVLHASAVIQGTRAIGFAGRSGAGKSTLASALARRGRTMIEDDGLILEPTPEGYLALPGHGTAKLWDSSRRLLGVGGGTPLAHQPGKFALNLGSEGAAAMALHDIAVLRDVDAPETGISQVVGADKLVLLGPVLFREYLLPHILGPARTAETLLRLAKRLRVWAIDRPRDPDRFADYVGTVDEWARHLPDCHPPTRP